MTLLSDDEYQTVCLESGGGPDSLQMWLELRRVLHPRRDHGWHFEVNNGDPAWAFGLAGEAHITVGAQRDWVTVFTYVQDDVEPYTSIADFESWLPAAERANAGFSPLYLELRSHIESLGSDTEMLRNHDEQLKRQSAALGLDEQT